MEGARPKNMSTFAPSKGINFPKMLIYLSKMIKKLSETPFGVGLITFGRRSWPRSLPKREKAPVLSPDSRTGSCVRA